MQTREDGEMPTELDLFQASPFAEDYPLSKEQVVGQQDGSAAWSSDIDHQLSLFVRKYCFDFAKASKALRSYVQHVSLSLRSYVATPVNGLPPCSPVRLAVVCVAE